MKKETSGKESIYEELLGDKDYLNLPKQLKENSQMIKLFNSKFDQECFMGVIINDEYNKQEGTCYRRLGKTETLSEFFEDKGNIDFVNYYNRSYEGDYEEYQEIINKIEIGKKDLSMLGQKKEAHSSKQIFQREQLDKMFSEKNVAIAKENPVLGRIG